MSKAKENYKVLHNYKQTEQKLQHRYIKIRTDEGVSGYN